MTKDYKCKICNTRELKKPEEESEIFWDNMQVLMDALWRDDYRYCQSNITDPDTFRKKAGVFSKMLRYKCCSEQCRTTLMKRSGTYIN